MHPIQLVPFLAGLSVILILGGFLRVLLGIRLKLYLMTRDSIFENQNLIPVTSQPRRDSLLFFLLRGSWREDVELQLRDYDDRKYVFEVSFHLWKRYHLRVRESTSGEVSINGKPAKIGDRFPVRTGNRLSIGGRTYTILVTTMDPYHVDFQRYLSAE